MDKCIFDRMDECHHSCTSCKQYTMQCCHCGTSDTPLYDICGDIMCADCLVKCEGSKLYSDFAEDYAQLFRDYCMEAWSGNLVS